MTCFGIYIKDKNDVGSAHDFFCLESKMAAKNWIDAINSFYRSTLRAALPNEDTNSMSGGVTTSEV
jgi:hypothetical protein